MSHYIVKNKRFKKISFHWNFKPRSSHESIIKAKNIFLASVALKSYRLIW